MVKQKTREQYISDGDRNTSFFDALLKVRRQQTKIKIARPDGRMISDPQEIGELAAQHFAELFKASEYHLSEELFQGVEHIITDSENEGLTAIPSTQEVRDAVVSLNPDSAPGVDGFTGNFFCEDFMAMVQGFFMGDYLMRQASSTLVVLIPKVPRPTGFADMRPISLGTFASKVISKIIANRLAILLPIVIDDHQSCFVKGRSIHESIALVQEMIQDIDKKSEGGNVVFKFDMPIAYDRLEWRFILRSLRAMGFSAGFQDLIYRHLCSIWYTININDFQSSQFRSSRGVRQGDPLSPMLFILSQQILSFNIQKLETEGKLQPYRMGRNVKPASHFFYADDMLVFSNGRLRALRHLKRLLNQYEASSGQQINLQKSVFYHTKHLSPSRIAGIVSLLGCQPTKLPFMYLGAPIFKGRAKLEYFEDIFQKVQRRLEGWKTKFLSFAGKIPLVNSVLASIPIHILSCTVVPNTVIIRFVRMMRTFLWSAKGTTRAQWVSWDNICLPKKQGGLGVRKLADIIYGFQGKLA